MSEGRWIGPLDVGGSWVGFRDLFTKVWACKGKTEEWYSLRVMHWGYSRRHVFQVHECGKSHVCPLLSYRLLEVSRWFLLMHWNLWVALSTWGWGPNAWRSSLGSCGPPMLLFAKTFLVKKSPLYAHTCPQTQPHLKAALFVRKGLTGPQRGTSGVCGSSYMGFWRSPGVSTEVVWASVVPSFKPVVCQASWKMMQRRKGWRTGREEKRFPFFGLYSDNHFWSNYCGTWLRREEKGMALFLSS